jgi:hypothetical protein
VRVSSGDAARRDAPRLGAMQRAPLAPRHMPQIDYGAGADVAAVTSLRQEPTLSTQLSQPKLELVDECTRWLYIGALSERLPRCCAVYSGRN